MDNLTNEIIETTEYDDVEVYDLESEETSGNGSVGLVLGLIGVAAVAGGVAYKCRNKIKAWNQNRQIKKLEKDGFVVFPADEVDVVEASDVEEVETTEE